MFDNWLLIRIISLYLHANKLKAVCSWGQIVKIYEMILSIDFKDVAYFYKTILQYGRDNKDKQTKDQSLLSSAFEELKPTWHHLLSPETVCLTSPLTAFACFLPCLSYPCPPLCLPFAPSRQGLVCLGGHLESWDLREKRVNIHIVPHDAGSGGRWPDRGHLVCCTKMHNFLFQLLWSVKGLG